MEKQQYLDIVIKPIMENLIFQLVCEKPDYPAEFMLNKLSKLANVSIEPLNEKEKDELNRLKQEVRKYREQEKSIYQDYEDESEEEIKVRIDTKSKTHKNTVMGTLKRSGVSAEAYGEFNPKTDFVPRMIKKNDDQILRIKNKIMQSFIFSNTDQKDVNIIIGAMEEKVFQEGEYVIKQGESGDCLYIIETGELDCYKKFTADDEDKYLRTYLPGESFGELALLYNAKRAATIISKTKSILWALDRETFNNIVKDSARRKREQYENFLKSCEIFSTVETYELGVICDALKPCHYKEGEYIIREGDIGDKFYIIVEGKAFAEKILESGQPPSKVRQYKKGDYFGELALIKGLPRAASVVANV